jgi:hypothetical protein
MGCSDPKDSMVSWSPIPAEREDVDVGAYHSWAFLKLPRRDCMVHVEERSHEGIVGLGKGSSGTDLHRIETVDLWS